MSFNKTGYLNNFWWTSYIFKNVWNNKNTGDNIQKRAWEMSVNEGGTVETITESTCIR